MNRLPYLIFTIMTFTLACSNASRTNIKHVSWTGSSHAYVKNILSADPKDSLNYFKYLYLAHHIAFDEHGDGILITRREYEAPRQFYSIKVSDSVVKIVYDLLQDTSVLHFKQPAFNEQTSGRLYCGFNYLISFTDNENQEKTINYLPPDANDKLKRLNAAFEMILNHPNILGKTQVDTLTLDSIVFAKAIRFTPEPPLRSRVKFTPPLIEPDLEKKDAH